MPDELISPKSIDALFNPEWADILMRASAEAWAILPSALQKLLFGSANGKLLEPQAITRPGPKTGRLARIPIIGPISKRDSFWSMFFGGATIESITAMLREAGNDDSISTVMLDIDSPGGTVNGMPELASEIRKLAESKHVVALANGLAASAAYWIASQADEIVATPESVVGSVGVFAVHEDWSKFMEEFGVKVSYIFAGRYKVEGNPDEPLSDEARAHMQGIVDEAYRLFVADVAHGRGVTPAVVRSDYGEGRVLTATGAKTAGMIDRIAGANETIRRLAGVKAESEAEINAAIDSPEPARASPARLALLRRQLSLQEAT